MKALSYRLSRADLVQISTLFFAILLFCIMIGWPQNTSENRSWFILVQVRIVTMSILSFSYGAQQIHNPRSERRLTLLALLGLIFLSAPLEIACYAASFPNTAWWWAMGITLLDTVALFGLGAFVSMGLHKLRLQALLPVLNIVFIVLLMTLDFGLKASLLSPLLAVTVLSPLHLAVMLVLASLTLVWINL